VNNFKLALTIVLLNVRKDAKLTTLGGRLFQATATRSLKKFTRIFRTFQAKIGRNLAQLILILRHTILVTSVCEISACSQINTANDLFE